MQSGVVKFFNSEKGFGFITPEEGGNDLFVHFSGVNGEIREGDNVSFDVEQGDRGLKAVNVSLD